MIRHKCHECFNDVESPNELAGGKDACPACGATVYVPEDEDDNRVVTRRQYEEAVDRLRPKFATTPDTGEERTDSPDARTDSTGRDDDDVSKEYEKANRESVIILAVFLGLSVAAAVLVGSFAPSSTRAWFGSAWGLLFWLVLIVCLVRSLNRTRRKD